MLSVFSSGVLRKKEASALLASVIYTQQGTLNWLLPIFWYKVAFFTRPRSRDVLVTMQSTTPLDCTLFELVYQTECHTVLSYVRDVQPTEENRVELLKWGTQLSRIKVSENALVRRKYCYWKQAEVTKPCGFLLYVLPMLWGYKSLCTFPLSFVEKGPSS